MPVQPTVQPLINLPTLTALISCLGAAVSALYAIIAGRLSRGNIAYQFFVRYSDEKMRQALIRMGAFKKKYSDLHGDEFLNIWYACLIKKEDWALELEESRHIIKYFYRDVATLYQAKCIKYKIAEKICTAGGIFLFDEVILPMEKKVNSLPYKNEYFPLPEIAEKMRKLRMKK